MIEALKSEVLANKVGGKFKLTALIQRRLVELVQGTRPLVERKLGMTDIEVVITGATPGEAVIRVNKAIGHLSALLGSSTKPHSMRLQHVVHQPP